MKLYIVSGGSKGLGEAIVTIVQNRDHHAVSISRSKTNHPHIFCDLSDVETIEDAFKKIFIHFPQKDLTAIHLINNAGMLDPIGPVSSFTTEEVNKNLMVNFNAPILLSRIFIKTVQDLDIPKTILNISSGAALNPYAGWSLYCAAKSGLEHFGRCVVEEQKVQKHPIKVINFNPGVMDTNMQKTIRKADPRLFPKHQKFIDLNNNNQLKTPASVAALVIHAIDLPAIVSGETITISDMENKYCANSFFNS